MKKTRTPKKRNHLSMQTDPKFEGLVEALLSHLQKGNHFEKISRSTVVRRAMTFYAQHLGIIPVAPSSSEMVDNAKVA
jgi:hypothetical protein